MQRSRSRNRFGGKPQFEILRDAAQAAALANGASLWYAGRQQDLAGFVFQDSAGTTPATGTDPIGQLKDRTGSFNATQATAANKPTLELQANGYYGMRFDGTNDSVDVPVFAVDINSNTVIAAANNTSGAIDRVLFNQRSAGNSIVANLGYSTGRPLYVQRSDAAGVRAATDAATRLNGPFVLTGENGSASGIVIRVNGATQATGTYVSLAPSTPTAASIGSAAVLGSNFFVGLLWLVCVSPVQMPDADRIAIERFAALLSGAAYT